MRSGFTLIEVLLGFMALALAVVAVLGAYLGQMTLNEHVRNLSLAVHDANRVMEQLRSQNGTGSCTAPSVAVAGGWDAWLNGQTPGKSIPNPNAAAEERIVVTCQDQTGTQSCHTTQVSSSEWQNAGAGPVYDPLRVTVSICWRHRNRTIGECTWANGTLVPTDVNGNGLIDSPAMLTTLVTCRS